MVTTDSERWEALTAALAEAVEHGDHAEARRLRDELTVLELEAVGQEIGRSLPPPEAHSIDVVADLFGCVATQRKGKNQ